MKSRTLIPTPEQLRQQANEMLRHAEQLEKTGATKDALKKSLVPALRELMQAKHKTQRAVDELVAELEGQVSHIERIIQEVLL